ncbi:hypothetical protein B0H19DRAFT_1251000 [Mycena capillaripes]|nr:hypothetical protein B0H19DRAFT_1251000 [Mycena capillaripes]
MKPCSPFGIEEVPAKHDLRWDLETYAEGTIQSVHPSDQPGIESYYEQLEAARRLAKLNPLAAGQSYSLALNIPQPNPDPAARSVPPVPNSFCVSLRLDQPLKTGTGKLSQVWTAVEEETGTTLVLKFIQRSMCPYPGPDCNWSEYREPEDLVRRETWSYEHLASKQGLLVPYFFGLDTITTPSGECAWVLVLEHIPGITLAALMDSPAKSFLDMCDAIQLSIDSTSAFTSDGWVHMDLEPRNILVTGSPGARGIVFIDLTFTCRLPSSNVDRDSNHRHRLYHHIVNYLDFDSNFIQWACANIPNIPMPIPI